MGNDHRRMIERYLEEGRSVSGGKGGDEAKAAQKRNEDRQDQAFNFQMQGMTDVKNAMQKYLTSAMLASIRSNWHR